MHDLGLRKTWDNIWRDHWYSDHARRVRRSQHKLDVILARHNGIRPGAIVFEIGCGVGYFTNGLSERNSQICQAIGCDHSLVALQRAVSQFADDRVQFAVGDATALPFPDNGFDAAFAICALEHVPNIDQAMRELSRVLKPSGDLFIFYSNRRSFFVWERWVRSLFGDWPYSFQQEITLKDLHDLICPTFLPDDWYIVGAESDFPILRRLDFLVHKFLPSWGRYIYVHATRDKPNV